MLGVREQPSEDFVPRDYQVEMKNICLRKNSIVYLPTGSGKTYIALMLMKEMSHQLQNSVEEGGKRMFFLTNTVALAKQQAQFFTRHLPFNVRLYTSEVNVDAWKGDRWIQEFKDVQVLVSTSQILLDVLRSGYLSPANINLIVFDECHRAVGQHPMHAIMKEVISVPKSMQPRIIGLSGTLLFKELKMAIQVREELERLENTFSATIITVGDWNTYQTVCGYSTNPTESVVYYESPMILSVAEECTKLVTAYKNKLSLLHLPRYSTISTKTMREGFAKPIKVASKLLNEFEVQLRDFGVYPASLAILGVMVELELNKRSSECDKARHMYRGAITFCEQLRHMLVSVMSGYSVKQQALQFSSSRVRNLLKYLELSFSGVHDNKKQVLLFVERRFTAKVLYHVTKRYFAPEMLDGRPQMNSLVEPEFIVGRNSSIEETIEEILVHKQDRKVIERFRKYQVNVLVATNVLEEGIDLQMCDTVIMFDEIKSYGSYMQSKGRARMETSTYLMLVPQEKKIAFTGRMKLYSEIDKTLKNELVGKTVDRPLPLEQDVHKELLDDILPPFYTPVGAKLDTLCSINLLNRYCMNMPNDVFTSSNITWTRNDLPGNKLSVSLTLPMQSTVRELVCGHPARNIKLAKQFAAFEACKRLYEAGELTDRLLPKSSKDIMQEVSDDYFKHWGKIGKEPNPRIAGTAKSVRAHKLVYPSETIGCTPQQADGEECFVYILRTKAHFSSCERIRSVQILQDLYDTPNTFGVLTRKPLPPLARMKFFVTLGTVNVELVPEPLRVRLEAGSGQLQLLLQFHLLVFHNMLKVWKPFTVLDGEPEENGFLLVPLLRSEEIDWELIKRFPYLRESSEPSPRARQQLRFEPERYLFHVIHPWYKNDPDKHYIVVRVHEDLRPTSPFPNERYRSYEHYFASEHHQTIVRREDQFLIEVKGISANLSRLHPGREVDGGSSSRAKHLDFQELLIPELVHNYEFPADYWLKATMLPSALHRIHYLLLAEGIRVDLATRAGIGRAECGGGGRPRELNADPLLTLCATKAGSSGVACRRPVEYDYDDEDELDDSEEEGQQEGTVLRGEKLRELVLQIQQCEPSVLEKLEYPWQESEVPLDLERHWGDSTKLDLDYYCSFLQKYQGQASQIAQKNNHLLTETNLDKQLEQLHLNDVDSSDSPNPRYASDTVTGSRPAAIEDGFGLPSEIRTLRLTPATTADVWLEQADILQALTTNTASDVFNLERFELLGDAFLKFAASLFVLVRHPNWHEGYMTTCKSRMVSNCNLLYCAMLYGLPGMIKAHPFDPKNDWVPPLSVVPAVIRNAMLEANETPAQLYKLELSEEEIRTGMVKQQTIDQFLPLIEKSNTPSHSTLQSVLGQIHLSDKAVADSMEALLGVCVKSVGYERSFRFLSHFGIIPKGTDLAQLLRDHHYPIVDYRDHLSEIDRMLCAPGKIESVLGYEFRNRSYLLQAFTHATYLGNNVTSSYQQLEFLGDAVLDFLVTLYIYERNPSMSPGQLTDLRSALVNNVNLACVLVRNGLHRYILSHSPMLTNTISKFVDIQARKHNLIGDWVRLLCAENDTPLVEYIDVPKVLGDVFEALIGAVYLDSGKDLDVTWRVCYRLLRREIRQFSLDTPIQVVRQLYEHPDAKPHFAAPHVDDDVVMVKLTYTLRSQRQHVYGFGKNKDDAKRAAAKIALSKLKE